MFDAKVGEEDWARGARAVNGAFGMIFAGKALPRLAALTCWAPPAGLSSAMFGELGLSLARAKRKLVQGRSAGSKDQDGAATP